MPFSAATARERGDARDVRGPRVHGGLPAVSAASTAVYAAALMIVVVVAPSACVREVPGSRHPDRRASRTPPRAHRRTPREARVRAGPPRRGRGSSAARSGVTSARRGCARSFGGDLRRRPAGSATRSPTVSSARLRKEYVGIRRPVVVDEVRVGGVGFERLVGVADAARHEDRAGGVELGREHGAEGRTFSQIHPGAEDASRGDGDPFVPRLGVDAARRADCVVERDVVLHRAEVGQTQRRHLLALPVLLEPAARVAVHGQFEDDAARESASRRPRAPCRTRRATTGPSTRRRPRWRPCGRPPRLVVAVPLDRRGEAGLEVAVGRSPAELGAQLRGVDRIAQVVPGAVGDVVVRVARLAHQLEDQLDDVLVVLLAVGADQIGLADLALLEDRQDGRRVVVGVDPVAHVLALAVELGPDAADDVGDLARDELLDVLVRTVVVRAVRDRRPDPERAHPRADQQVAAGLRRRVRGRGVVRRLLGEARRIVELEVAVHLVGGDVVEVAGRAGAPPPAACTCRRCSCPGTAAGRGASCRCATPRRSARPRPRRRTARRRAPASVMSPCTNVTRSSGSPSSESRLPA